MSDRPTLWRAAHLRVKDAELTELVQRDDALFALVWRDKNLVTTGESPRADLVDRAAAAPLLALAPEAVFLGTIDDRPCFALGLPGDDEHARGRNFGDLRMVGAFVPQEDARLLAYARGMVHWHRHHGFCGKCGAATRSAEGGHVRICSACDKRHFPRSDPAMMAMVLRGDSVLLARQASWPKSMYSILAGFVEPGESVEESVVREVHEEVGLRVRDLRYVRSQPWPFPSSLMIGFVMHAEDGEVVLDPTELEASRWVTRKELAEPDGSIFVPPPFSLSGQLIAMFVAGELPV
jgi:NAD+ diphosphatase